MVAIGELAFKTRFDGRELTRGLMSTRAQMSAAKKLAEETRTPLDRYRTGLDNLAEMSKRYSHVAERQIELSKQLEKQYLQEESAVRKLTRTEKARLELLQMPDQIKARAANAVDPRVTRDAANKRAGLARQSFFQEIENQRTSGRAALAERLAAFKKERAAVSRAEEIAQAKAAREAQSQSKARSTGGMFGMSALPKYIGAAAAYSYAKSSVLKFAEVEKSAAAFEVLSGSLQKSNQLMADLREMAKTGLSFSALASSAQTMLSFGLATEKVVPTLRALGEIARGDGERLKSLALAFGQTTAAGRLMGQEVLQMINAGFNPLQEISRKTGKSMIQLKKEMEEGGISASMVADSLISATTAGGRFEGMLAKINQTGAGSLTTIQNKFEAISLAVGESLIPLVRQLAGAMDDLTKSSTGRADSAADVLGNGVAGSVALLRSVLRNDWKPVSELLDTMDAKSRDAKGAAAATASTFSDTAVGRLEKQRSEETKKLLRMYQGKNSGFYKSQADYETNITKQRRFLGMLDAEITKQRALQKIQDDRTQARNKEAERAAAVKAMTQPLEDKLKLDQFNAKSDLKAASLEEMNVISKMNSLERQRLVYLQEQTKEKEKESKAKPNSRFESMKTRAEDIAYKAGSPIDQFRSQLKEIQVMAGMGMIQRDVARRAISSAYDSTVGARRPEMQLAPDLQMGSQGAYQALVGIRNSAQERMLKAQEKQADIQRESNRLLAEVRTAIKEMKDELKEVLPGDGG